MPRQVFAEDIERFLTSLRGIAAARIVATPEGEITEVYVTAEQPSDPRLVRRGIVAALLSAFRIPIEPDRIVMTPLRAGLRLPDVPHLRIARVQEEMSAGEVTATVQVVCARGGQERYASGRSSGPAGEAARVRALAAATVLAARGTLPPDQRRFNLKHANAVTFMDHPAVLVAITVKAPQGLETVIGVAGAGDEEHEPAVAAALDAVTKWLVRSALRAGEALPADRRQRLAAMQHFLQAGKDTAAAARSAGGPARVPAHPDLAADVPGAGTAGHASESASAAGEDVAPGADAPAVVVVPDADEGAAVEAEIAGADQFTSIEEFAAAADAYEGADAEGAAEAHDEGAAAAGAEEALERYFEEAFETDAAGDAVEADVSEEAGETPEPAAAYEDGAEVFMTEEEFQTAVGAHPNGDRMGTTDGEPSAGPPEPERSAVAPPRDEAPPGAEGPAAPGEPGSGTAFPTIGANAVEAAISDLDAVSGVHQIRPQGRGRAAAEPRDRHGRKDMRWLRGAAWARKPRGLAPIAAHTRPEGEGGAAMGMRHDTGKPGTGPLAGPPRDRPPSMEDQFYRTLIAERTPVQIRCRDGYVMERATIKDCATYTLLVETSDGTELVFKHSLISIRILAGMSPQA